MSDPPVVIGLGSRHRGDDVAGLEVVGLLRERAPGVRAVAHEREPTDLIGIWAGADAVVVVDAVAGERPGRVHRFDVSSEPLPALGGTRSSTHAIELGETIELARELGRLPARIEVIAIEGERFGLGAEPSAAVRDAVGRVAAELAAA